MVGSAAARPIPKKRLRSKLVLTDVGVGVGVAVWTWHMRFVACTFIENVVIFGPAQLKLQLRWDKVWWRGIGVGGMSTSRSNGVTLQEICARLSKRLEQEALIGQNSKVFTAAIDTTDNTDKPTLLWRRERERVCYH